LKGIFDDTNVPSEILIGANENGKANDLESSSCRLSPVSDHNS